MHLTKGGEAPTNPTSDDDDQASLVIQREVGMALRQSFKAAAREPLPQQIALLLLRLALAESLQTSVEKEGERAVKGDASRWGKGFASRLRLWRRKA